MDQILSALPELLSAAFSRRASLFADPETTAFRVFNGFCEGCPAFSIDRYGSTAVILWMKKHEVPEKDVLDKLCGLCLDGLPGISSVLYKNRFSAAEEEKKGILLYGEEPVKSIREWGVSYPVDLRLNKDCGFYLDSALLRRWLLEHSAGKRVLNTFAYTGSLGDAAQAGGALSVTQTDLNRNYLHARHSGQEYLFGDFFHTAASLRRSNRLFDTVILDPPFFANAGRSAKVDQARNAAGLINKIRPLTAHRGRIIVVNNALFLSGKDFLAQLGSLCGDCLSIGEIIPVPGSFFGYKPLTKGTLPADPAPFGHPTKIIILNVMRKDQRA
ncbi:MAG: class I SAM-dependent methyltransferase [Anaerolineaceae bacterium]|nr:class I SAM-dependent methyltransferase [Anaerolineaceae bacterium]